MQPQSRSKLRWPILYGSALIMDAAQFLADLTGVGVAASEAAEPFIGAALIGLFKYFGISVITRPKRFLSMVAGGLADAVTGGMAPFWVVDIWYIHTDVKAEEAGEDAEMMNRAVRDGTPKPLNQGDERQPSYNRVPLNQGDTRLPSGNYQAEEEEASQ